jgi:hypothetical protein
MYVIIPRKLPSLPNVDSSEIHVEFAGIMRSGDGQLLRRSVMTYNCVNGSLKGVRHESHTIRDANTF